MNVVDKTSSGELRKEENPQLVLLHKRSLR